MRQGIVQTNTDTKISVATEVNRQRKETGWIRTLGAYYDFATIPNKAVGV